MNNKIMIRECKIRERVLRSVSPANGQGDSFLVSEATTASSRVKTPKLVREGRSVAVRNKILGPIKLIRLSESIICIFPKPLVGLRK